MRATGQGGELRVGYQHAASVERWSLQTESGQPPTYVVDATIREVDTFWATQEPMTLVLRIGKSAWRWRQVRWARNGNQTAIITALGRPQIEKG